jgi:hypothetical protein
LIFLAASAGWLPERRKTLARLRAQVERTDRLVVLESPRREHASVWATRLWEEAARHDEPAVCLNDDVILHPRFQEIVRAMVEAVPGEVLSLHTNMPGAVKVARDGHHWGRTYWLSGPAYCLPPGVARSLLDFPVPWTLRSSINEDNLAIHWMWDRQRPAWCAIPAPVTHDIAVPSLLGYDLHPNRVPTVPWENFPLARMEDPGYWRATSDPPHVENPWMSAAKMQHVRRVLVAGARVCSICCTEEGVFGRPNGHAICPACVFDAVEAFRPGRAVPPMKK